MRYPFIRPMMPLPEEWLEWLTPAYEQRRYSNRGPVVARLELELERRYASTGRRVVLTTSGTAGLLAALLALDVQGAVAIPSFTFPATANAVLLAGCNPLFVDVSARDWELDLSQLERVLARARVGAIVHVRSLGLCRTLDQLEQLASSYQVPLIVDAAACLGGRENAGAWTGGRGDAEVFSMHATKPFGIGEGGAVFVRSNLEQRLRQTINFGFADGVPRASGFNGKLSEVQAAIGLAVLERFDRFVARRSEVANAYRDELAAEARLEHGQAVGAPPWQAYPVAVPGDAESVTRRIFSGGVEARRYYAPPLHRTPAFAERAFLPTTENLSARMICLPVYSDMADRELEEIIELVNRALVRAPRRSVGAAG